MAAGTAGGGPLFSPPVQSQGVLSVPEAFLLPGSDGLVGERAMLSFKDSHGGLAKSGRNFFQSFNHEEIMDDDLDEYLRQPEKKRRLSADQVQFLEKSFELEDKLEPERKVQLAKDLGLKPRQIAIWFQNRRARWKTKGLEKGYEALQGSYNALEAEYDVLIKERDVLKDQVHDLTYELQLNPGFSSKILEGIVQNPTVESVSNDVTNISNILPSKHDEICVAKSDMLDSDSPRYADCSPSQLLEPGDASCAFNWDRLDISQDEENLSITLLPTHTMFSKLDNNDLADPLGLKSSPFGFSADDHAVWSWPY